MTTAYGIARDWLAALENSVALNGFCTGRFGSLANLYLGSDPGDLPGVKDAPFVAVLPGKGSGGFSEEESAFTLSVFLGIRDDGMVREERRTEYQGYRTIEQEFAPLVLEALEQSGEHVPDSWNAEIGMIRSGFFLMEIFITVKQANTLGF